MPVVGTEAAAFYLEPVPRDDAVVLNGADAIVPGPLQLRGGSNA